MDVADVLIYWRDYEANESKDSASRHAHVWHSSAKCIAELQPGDQMWMITSGKALRHETEQAAFLVGIWVVREVIDNPNDDPAYPDEQYRKRVIADPSGSVMLHEPVAVDHILRPEGRDRAASIGRFLQGPRKLTDEMKRLLRTAAGGELAAAWLGSKSR